MGSSKLILLAATSLIVGIYSVSIKRVESNSAQASAKRANTVQLDRLTETALRLVLDDIARNGTRSRWQSERAALGGIFTYSIKGHGSKLATVNLVVSIGGLEKTVKAKVEKVEDTTAPRKNSLTSIRRGDWVVSKYFAKKVKDKEKMN